MTTKSLRPFATTLLAAILLTGTAAVRASIPSAEYLLPADTLGFFTVPDCAAFRAEAKTSPQMLFWNDPSMQAFHDKLVGQVMQKYVAPLEQDLGMKVADFASLPQGQFTLAITQNGSNGHDGITPGVVLLLDSRDQSDQLKKNLAGLVKKWTADGRNLRTEQIHGLNYTIVTLSTNDLAGILPKKQPVSDINDPNPKPQQPVDIYFTQFQSLLVAVNSPKLAESIASRLTGGSNPTLDDDAVFSQDKLSQFHNSPTYYGWFNGRLLFDQIMQIPPPSDDSQSMAPSPAKMVAALGLDAVKSISMAMRETSDGTYLSLHIGTAGEASGIMKILAFSAKDASPPPFVPADAVKFSRMRLDGKKAWAELQKVAASISPSALSGLNSMVDMANSVAQQKDPSFDLQTYLFGNLGDDVISYQKPSANYSPGQLSTPPAITLVGSPNPDRIIQSIKVLGSMIAQQDSTPPRDFMGHKIYSISSRAQRRADGSTVSAPPLLMTSAGGYAAFSQDSSIIEDYLRSADGKVKPLSVTPGFSDAIEHVGGPGGGLLGYQNQRETMRATFDLVKNPDGANAMMRMFPEPLRGWFDFSLLPDYSSVSKYFYISVFSGNTTANGMTLNVYTPRPPNL